MRERQRAAPHCGGGDIPTPTCNCCVPPVVSYWPPTRRQQPRPALQQSLLLRVCCSCSCFSYSCCLSAAYIYTSFITMDGDQAVSSTHQYRKVMKPLLERKRRARINSCLEELKELMEATGCSGEGMQRLEKADVLEVTVRHLRDLKAHGRLAAGTDITSTATFRSGFSACAREVSSFITTPGSGVEQQQALHIALGVADGLRRLQDGRAADNTFQNNSENIENLRPRHQPSTPPAQERAGQIGHQGLTEGGGNPQSLLTHGNQPLQPSYALQQQPLTSKPVEPSLDSSSGHPLPLDLSLK